MLYNWQQTSQLLIIDEVFMVSMNGIKIIQLVKISKCIQPYIKNELKYVT